MHALLSFAYIRSCSAPLPLQHACLAGDCLCVSAYDGSHSFALEHSQHRDALAVGYVSAEPECLDQLVLAGKTGLQQDSDCLLNPPDVLVQMSLSRTFCTSKQNQSTVDSTFLS